MSYSVHYNPELGRRYPSKVKDQRNLTRPIIILMIVAVVVYASVQSGMVKFLIPGNPEITTAAFSQLIEQVAAGESVGQSIRTFCEDVITGGT